MKVKIRSIVNHGQTEERIILDVISETEIGEYLILDTTYIAPDKVSNKVRHPFWFPDQKVKSGDVVVLYTRKGSRSSKNNANGSVSYFFYWGLESFIWNNDEDCALLFHIDNWESHKVGSSKIK